MKTEEQNQAIAESLGITITGEQHGIPFGWKNGEIVNCPNYCASFDACMELCAFLATRGYRCDLNMGADGTWECTFHHSTRPLNSHYAPADKLPAAICECFLRTLNLWKE